MSLFDDIRSTPDIREIAERARVIMLKKAGIYKIKFPSEYPSDSKILQGFKYNSIHKLADAIRKKSSNFLFDLKKSQGIFPILFKDKLPHIIEAADRISGHEFGIFERKVAFGDVIDWHFSETGRNWPSVHWSLLNINYGMYGDVKYTWELNKHQFFSTLGKAFLISGNKKYLREFIDMIKTWIEQNPPEIGVNWANNQELAYRSISWITALNFFAHELNNITIIDILRVLLKHAQHIYGDINYTVKCVRNSHILGDAVGLAVLAMFLSEYSDADKWYKKAYDTITNAIKWIFQEDGSYSLFSPNYHRISLYFLLLYALVAKRHEYTLPPKIWKTLENGIFALSHIMQSSGLLPVIGYSDNAKPVRLTEDASDNIMPLLAIASVLFENAYFKTLSGGQNEELFWLLGAEGMEKYNAIQANNKIKNASVQLNNGIYVLNGEKFQAYVLGGSHPVNSQRHSDYLSIGIIFRGLDFIVDGGNYKYNTERRWNHYFRSSFAHNTVIADGKSQALPYREFRWLNRGECFLNEFSEQDKYTVFDGWHNAYEKSGIRHRRIVILFKGQEFLLIIDRITGKGSCELGQLFHTGFCDVELDKKSGITTIRKDDTGLQIVPILNTDLSFDIIKGQGNPIQGWISCCYGEKRPSPVLIYKQKKLLPAYFITAVLPFGMDFNYNVPKLSADILALDIRTGSSAFLVVHIFKEGGVFNYNEKAITKSSIIKL